MVGIEHEYRYRRASELARGRLALATSGGMTNRGSATHPFFFSGSFTRVGAVAGGVLALAEVARADYRAPQRPIRADPVVTCDGHRLRLESLSSCGGVYARLDVLEAGMDGQIAARGTTNVDVGNRLREALARVGDRDDLLVAVGENLTVMTSDGAVVEKRVSLTDRWLRGFAEVAVAASSFELRAEVSAAEAVRFLRGVSSSGRDIVWVLPVGSTLRASAAPRPGSACAAGVLRLRSLLPLLRFARCLRMYGPRVTAGSDPVASAWELDLAGARYGLTLSPGVRRGFSGEGGILDALIEQDAVIDAELFAALLDFDVIDPDELARRTGISRSRVPAALVALCAEGQVGYDVAEAAYFHRELPYGAGRIAELNPRLGSARRLVRDHAVTFVTPDQALVQGEGQPRTVRLADADASCTCRWWAETQGSRGPCKHVLAARIVRAGTGRVLR